MRRFGILRFVTDSSVVQFLGFFATMLLIVALSMLVGAIQHRWRATGLLTAAASVVVIDGLAATLVTWTRSWSSLWSWIVDASPTTTLVALPPAGGRGVRGRDLAGRPQRGTPGRPPSGTGSAPTLSGSGPNSVLAQRAEVTAG